MAPLASTTVAEEGKHGASSPVAEQVVGAATPPDGLSIARRKTLSLDLICIVAVYFVDACPGKDLQTQPAVRVRVRARVRVRD